MEQVKTLKQAITNAEFQIGRMREHVEQARKAYEAALKESPDMVDVAKRLYINNLNGFIAMTTFYQAVFGGKRYEQEILFVYETVATLSQ